MPKKAKKSFEENLANLENIISELEEGNISLDETVKKYKDGMTFATDCLKMLNDAQAQISIYENEQLVSFEGR